MVKDEPEKQEKVKKKGIKALAQMRKAMQRLAQRLLREALAELTEILKKKSKSRRGTIAALVEEHTLKEERIVLADKEAKAIRNKPHTRAQVRNEPMISKEDGSNTKKAGKRIKRIADSTKAAADYEQEKEELRMWLAVVPYKDETVDPELLFVKYPIVDWESQNLGNLMDLHRLVMKRFEDNTPEGYNLLLWGDLKVMFKPNAEDEIWSNQQDWTLISWKLYENCGVH
ncbi:hypothetical protein Tco_0810875 [Tanacetum coccineum]